ncbi:MAG: CCA tRNA nucleotidyltransferase [Candidatus Rokubacteria bacterium]|nr:CCA tRNA nucleotidyltransferase [Candidatus Rokubacteria bacterium]
MAVLRLDRLSPAGLVLLRAVATAAARREAWLVGGAVRDAFLRRAPGADVDVVLPSGALVVGRRVGERTGGAFVLLDAERGAARVVAGDARLDLADFRAPTLAGDLAARDFTVNALAVPIRDLLERGSGPLVDPTGGLADLRARRLRVPGPRVLGEDPLRALRGVRLEAALGLRLTPRTARAIRAAAPGLALVAAERVRDEVLAILALPRAARALRRMDALGLLAVILPEADAMRGCAQPAPHRFNVLEHSLRAVEAADRLLPRLPALTPLGEELAAHVAGELGGGVARAVVLKLAALLHDVSKPETRRVIGGRVRFFEHDLLLLALVDAAALTGASPLAVWRRARLIRDLLSGWQEQHAAAAAPPLVRGEDVMRHLNLPPGPSVGRLLAQVREAQDLGRVATREEALAYLDSLAREP